MENMLILLIMDQVIVLIQLILVEIIVFWMIITIIIYIDPLPAEVHLHQKAILILHIIMLFMILLCLFHYLRKYYLHSNQDYLQLINCLLYLILSQIL